MTHCPGASLGHFTQYMYNRFSSQVSCIPLEPGMVYHASDHTCCQAMVYPVAMIVEKIVTVIRSCFNYSFNSSHKLVVTAIFVCYPVSLGFFCIIDNITIISTF